VKRHLLIQMAICATPILASVCHADDFCTSLKSAIAAAPSQFSRYKGSWDADAEWYNTSWRIPGTGADDCQLSYDEDDGYSLSCDLNQTSFSGATAAAEGFSDQIEQCLKPGKYEAQPWRDANRTDKYTSSQFHSRTILAPANENRDVSIYVSAMCSVRTKTGRERCHAGITLDLLGDEK
jgi:hypothetical protein